MLDHFLKTQKFSPWGILDGNSEYVVLARRKMVCSEKKYMIGDCSLSNQMPQTDQITEIFPYVRTYF